VGGVHSIDLDTRQDDAGATKILEAQNRFDDAFDGAMVLLDNVVEILVLPDCDGRFTFSIDRLQGGQIGTAFVHGDRLGGAVLVNRLLEVATRRSLVAMRPQKKIDGLSILVYSTIQVLI
jgi:hypothetical protein